MNRYTYRRSHTGTDIDTGDHIHEQIWIQEVTYMNRYRHRRSHTMIHEQIWILEVTYMNRCRYRRSHTRMVVDTGGHIHEQIQETI